MTTFEVLVLRGLWLILRLVLKTNNRYTGTDELMWAKAVSEAAEDDELKAYLRNAEDGEL